MHAKGLRREKLQTVGWGMVGILLVLLLWYAAVTFTVVGRVIPPPQDVGASSLHYLTNPMGKRTLLGHLLVSLRRVFIGYGLAVVTGILIGLGMGFSKMARAVIYPIFSCIRPIPGVAWIPLAILWFGIGESAKHFIIFVGGFSNIVINCMAGAQRIDRQLVGVAELLGANKRQVFLHVLLPSTVPYIFAGLQIALSTSWMAVLAAEMVSSYEGAGWIINTGMNNGNTVQILVGMIWIGIVGLILASLMRFLEKKLCAWNVRGR